ncbi:hypothetical protein B0J11DRAFT_35843 [Dendryphion nanum]|uniref:F-box domain-containing protein n=1 Tax=Dendryphion nanum TaxID=256645 RepID=A0A9P9ELB9_9PLEO|nr:hypothetical protein B0J11DRAFT_35843 [Dendryphion nanum]
MASVAPAMGTQTNPLGLSSPALPAYIARHVHLGFDADDLNALLDSIDSSQCGSHPSLPQIPAEILLLILENVPSDHILCFRYVCRGFRDYIDTRLPYSYLHRTELFCLFNVQPFRTYPLSKEQLEIFKTMRMSFSHVEDSRRTSFTALTKRKWDAKCAVYNIDPAWCKIFDTLRQMARSHPTLINEQQLLSEIENSLPYDKYARTSGALRWVIKLDHGALDLDITTYKVIDLDKKSVSVEWREGLLQFLKTENRLRMRKWKNRDREYTYSHTEDCLRQIRRECIRSLLDLDDGRDKLVNWSMRTLRPLFGGAVYAKLDDAWNAFERDENQAMYNLMLLRKEAAMPKKEREQLAQLVKDRVELIQDLSTLDSCFAMFKNQISDIVAGCKSNEPIATYQMTAFPDLPINVLEWDDETVLKESKRVAKWKSQKITLEKIKFLISMANEALSLPEDAFDSDS